MHCSPIPVDNPVHNRFLVTETSPAINRLDPSAAFLTTASSISFSHKISERSSTKQGETYTSSGFAAMAYQRLPGTT